MNIENFFPVVRAEDWLRSHTEYDAAFIKSMLHSYIAEAEHGYRTVAPYLEKLSRNNTRILEVGAGSCLLSGFLANRGWNIFSLDPEGIGFGFLGQMRRFTLN